MDFEWEELINGESEIDAEDLNLLASRVSMDANGGCVLVIPLELKD